MVLCGQKLVFLIKTLVFGVHFGVHILTSFSLYNKSPSSIFLEELFCYLFKIQIVPDSFGWLRSYQGSAYIRAQQAVRGCHPSKYQRCRDERTVDKWLRNLADCFYERYKGKIQEKLKNIAKSVYFFKKICYNINSRRCLKCLVRI